MSEIKNKTLNYVFLFFILIIIFILSSPRILGDLSANLIEDKINQQINNSKNSDIVFLNEYKECLRSIISYRPFSKIFKTISIENFNENKEDIYDYCLSYQMKRHLKNDASRYDFLEKKINEKGLTFHLKDEKFDYNKLF